MEESISFEEFKKIKLKTARVLAVQPHPQADKLIVLKIDVGGRQKQLVAGLKGFYEAKDLLNKTIIVVDNLQPAKLRGILSEGMLLAAQDNNGISVLTVL